MVSLHIQRVTTMSEEIIKIASALERIADALEKKWHIDIDHGHIESIDNIEHGDVDVHNHTF
jgi:SAM-dependent MidA family methyltransferase